jgi:hypothetical protein
VWSDFTPASVRVVWYYASICLCGLVLSHSLECEGALVRIAVGVAIVDYYYFTILHDQFS